MDAFVGGRIFDGDAFLNNRTVLVEDGLVVDIVDEKSVPNGSHRIHLNNQLLVPGFVDGQVNGGGGVMVNGAITPADLETIARAHRQFGTTAFLPTLISDDLAAMKTAAGAVQAAMDQNIPGIVGIHFEGPLLNRERKGIHNPDHFCAVEDDLLALYASAIQGVRVVTLAPEVVPAGTISALTRSGVRVSAGHTAGTYDHMQMALNEGLAGFTHLFNAMTPLTGRAPGVVGAALDDDTTWCGLIVDGWHVHEATLRTAIRAKRQGKMMLVTDAMASVGSDLSSFDLHGQRINVADGRCMADDGTLAGSDLDMASAVRNTVTRLGLPLEEALRMASLYPAEFLGLDDQRGRIRKGGRADFALLDDTLHVSNTWIGGQE